MQQQSIAHKGCAPKLLLDSICHHHLIAHPDKSRAGLTGCPPQFSSRLPTSGEI
jgi:hypothetical protein